MTELSDANIVELAQSGDLEAVGNLYDRYWLRIFNYVRAKVYDNHLAEDLTGEVFLRMVEHLPKYRTMEGVPFSAWLFRIAHNLIITHHRKEIAFQQVPMDYMNNQTHQDGPALMVESNLERTRLLQGLAKLDETQREVIILRFLVGMSLKEAAESLNKTVGAIKTLQRRGILALVVFLKTS